jgi:hypothetical protein
MLDEKCSEQNIIIYNSPDGKASVSLYNISPFSNIRILAKDEFEIVNGDPVKPCLRPELPKSG